MSRLGKLPISIPAGVQTNCTAQTFTAKGPKGEVVEHLPSGVKIDQTGNIINITVKNPESGEGRAMWGLVRQLVANAVQGAAQGFSKKLEISGVGFKAQVEGKDLVLNLGFSHPVRYSIPGGITITVEKNTINVSGSSKQQVGQVSAEIRSLKKPEPYKGKGIKYSDEVVRRKAGKVVKAAGK